MAKATKVAYVVTIKREGSQWVARDGKGLWRARGAANHSYFDDHEAKGRKLAEFLFHADEIGGVKVDGDGVTHAEILVNA